MCARDSFIANYINHVQVFPIIATARGTRNSIHTKNIVVSDWLRKHGHAYLLIPIKFSFVTRNDFDGDNKYCNLALSPSAFDFRRFDTFFRTDADSLNRCVFCFRKYSRFRPCGLHVDQIAKSLRFVWRIHCTHTYTFIQFSISFHIRNNSLPFFVIFFSLQFGSAFLEVGRQLFCLFVI